MEKIVILFIDAFSYSYIDRENTPFLSTQDTRPLTPVFGFKQLASAFGYPDPLSTGFFAEHYFDPARSPHRWSRISPPFLLSAIDRLPRFLIDMTYRHILRQTASLKLVPLDMLRFFITDNRAYPDDSPLIALLREKGLTQRLIFYPEAKTNVDAFNLLQEMHGSGQLPQFLLVHFPSLDQLGHISGTTSEYLQQMVQQTDRMIGEVVAMFGRNSRIIIFSDHGMCEVKGTINVLEKIREAGRPGKEFAVFLDSTMARFWTFRESSLETITRILGSERHGQVIPLQNPEMRDRFGDILFLVSPGYLIYPNYYDSKPPKAMHGYNVPLPSESDLNGILFTVNMPNLTLPDKLSMLDLYPILKQAIESL